MFEDEDEARQYQVVVNHEDQYSLWPDDRALPDGWTATGFVGDKATCLGHIDEVWVDMRPRSLRLAMDADTTDSTS